MRSGWYTDNIQGENSRPAYIPARVAQRQSGTVSTGQSIGLPRVRVAGSNPTRAFSTSTKQALRGFLWAFSFSPQNDTALFLQPQQRLLRRHSVQLGGCVVISIPVQG